MIYLSKPTNHVLIVVHGNNYSHIKYIPTSVSWYFCREHLGYNKGNSWYWDLLPCHSTNSITSSNFTHIICIYTHWRNKMVRYHGIYTLVIHMLIQCNFHAYFNTSCRVSCITIAYNLILLTCNVEEIDTGLEDFCCHNGRGNMWRGSPNPVHYRDIKWPSRCLKLLVNRVFVQQFIPTDKKNWIKGLSALLSLCDGNPPVTSGFPTQKRDSNAENVSMWWRHKGRKGEGIEVLFKCA